jgi:hypothetical protein
VTTLKYPVDAQPNTNPMTQAQQIPPAVTNPTPKTRFLESGLRISEHRKMVDSPAFQAGADSALLEYSALLSTQSVDGQGAAANHFKLRGAQEFLQVLRNLSETPPQIIPVKTPSLIQPS